MPRLNRALCRSRHLSNGRSYALRRLISMLSLEAAKLCQSLSKVGIRFALPKGMELYDVKAPLLRCPLNSAEISHLFRSGYLHRRIRCKPEGAADWKTIGELFPLLGYNFAGYSLPSEGSHRRWRRFALPLLAVLVVASVYVCWDRSTRDSANGRSIAQATDHHVEPPIVIARSN